MPPRRSHKKSRKGCRRCKLRKIKCDEIHPRCGNCLKHGVSCDFENGQVSEYLLSASPAGPATPVTPATPAAPRSPVPPPPINTSFPSCSGPRSTSPTLDGDGDDDNVDDDNDDNDDDDDDNKDAAAAAATARTSSPPAILLRTPCGTLPPLLGSASTPPMLWPSPSMAPLDDDVDMVDDFPPPLPPPPPLPLPPPSSPPLPPPPPPPVRPPHCGPTFSPTFLTPAGRLMEMRLLHQYTTATYKTLSTALTPAAVETWKLLVPRAAFASVDTAYLADALLSVAALHLRSTRPHDREVVRACHTYMASSVAEYRAALATGISDDNAEALFLTATLISFQSTASRIYLRDDEDGNDDNNSDRDDDAMLAAEAGEYRHPDQIYADEPVIPSSSNRDRSAYTLPLSWFHSFQGVKTIVATSWLRIRHSPAVQAIVDSQPVLRLDLDAVAESAMDESSSLASSSFFGHLLDGISDELAVEDDEEIGLGLSTRQSYVHAVAVLNWAHKSPHKAAALAFPATVAKRFVDLVELRRPRALAVLACFFALLRRLEDVWWLRGATRREVMGIVSLFEQGSPWWQHLEWPIRIALFDEGRPVPAAVWGSDCAAEERRMKKLKREERDGGMGGGSVVDHIEMFTQSQSAGAGPLRGWGSAR